MNDKIIIIKPRNMLTIAPHVTFVCEKAMLNRLQSQPFNRHLTSQTATGK